MATGTLRVIRRRIRSIENTAKVTRAMELVAASKMRRAQARALAARPYAERLRWMLADLAENMPLMDPETLPPLLQKREVRNIGLLLLTTERGLCGGLNANLNRRAAGFALEQTVAAQFISVGRKGSTFLRRAGQPVIAEFSSPGDFPSYEDLRPVARLVMDEYIAGQVDQVFIVYPFFVNTAVQRPEVMPLLPVDPPRDSATYAVDYIYEPTREAVLEALLPRYVEQQIYAAVLELSASEQSARMVAMRNATENAREMIQDLTLVYNKARQETITTELLDITGGAEALKKTR